MIVNPQNWEHIQKPVICQLKTCQMQGDPQKTQAAFPRLPDCCRRSPNQALVPRYLGEEGAGQSSSLLSYAKLLGV